MRRRVAALVGIVMLGACTGTDRDADDLDPVAPVPHDGEPGDEDAAAPDDAEEPDPTDGLTRAAPGRWPVGDAGSVVFDLDGGRLALVEVATEPGWEHKVDKDEGDELAVTFRQGGDRWGFTVKLDDGVPAIEIDTHLREARPGRLRLPDDGGVTLAISEGRLVVTDLVVPVGWLELERDDDEDALDLELAAVDGRRYELEVEVKGGQRLEVRAIYEVRG